VYGMDENEHRALTGKSHYNRAVRSIRRLIESTENKDRLAIGFRFLTPRDDKEILEWMKQNLGTTLRYGAGSEYCDWQNASERCDETLNIKWHRNASGYRGQCFFPMVVSQVYSNGDVSFCKHQTDIDSEHYLGNLRNSSLADIFNSEKNRQLWRFEDRVPTICQKCMQTSYWYRPIEELQANESMYFESPLDLIGA